jgi:uncharacterized membrane protein YfhO
MSRYFFVSSVVSYVSDDAVYAAIQKGEYDPRTAVGVVKNTSLTQINACDASLSQNSSIRITSYTPNAIEMDVTSDCGGVISSSDVYYPGWILRINNVATPLLQGNGAFRTFAVPKGNSHVVLQYIPFPFFLGLGVTIFTGVAIYLYSMVITRRS